MREVVPARRELLVAVGTFGSQLCAYALNIVASRGLGTAVFGEFASLLTLSVVLGLPATALQQWAARIIADERRSGSGSSALRTVIGTTVGISVGAALLAFAVTAAIAPLLDTPRWGAALAVASVVLPLAWMSAGEGVLLGNERFGRLAVAFLIAGVARLVGVGGVALGVHTAWVVVLLIGVGSTIGAVAVLVLAQVGRDLHLGHAQPGAVLQILFATGAIWALGNVDVVLARANLTKEQAGVYAAGALVARAAQWAPQFIAVSSFTHFTDPARSRAALREALLKVGALGVLVVAGLAVLGTWVVPLVFGDDYRQAGHLAWRFAVLGILLAVNQLLIMQRIARHDERAAALVWTAAGVYVVSVALYPTLSIDVMLVIGWLVGVVLAGALFARVVRRDAQPAEVGV